MAVVPMKVAKGCNDRASYKDENNATHYVPNVASPYVFSAQEVNSSGTVKKQTSNSEKEVIPVPVYLVMPLGGNESGLYRSPKEDEYVLICQDTDNYLMGYLPALSGSAMGKLQPFDGDTESNSNPPGMTDLLQKQGEVFRYQKQGGNTTDETHSEIGFYRERAQWPLTEGGTDNPQIDTVKISSTGDIASRAENHHLITGKRMELLADCDEIDHTTNKTASGERPLGDKAANDSALHAGDVHIRAGRRVVIKAEESIELNVGRSSLLIDDEGLTAISRILSETYLNSADAILTLSPRDGVSMSGKKFSASGQLGINLGDDYGGSLSTKMGLLRITGRGVSISGINKEEYFEHLFHNSLEYVADLISSSIALVDNDSDMEMGEWVADTIRFVFRSLDELFEMERKFFPALAKLKKVRLSRRGANPSPPVSLDTTSPDTNTSPNPDPSPEPT